MMTKNYEGPCPIGAKGPSGIKERLTSKDKRELIICFLGQIKHEVNTHKIKFYQDMIKKLID